MDNSTDLSQNFIFFNPLSLMYSLTNSWKKIWWKLYMSYFIDWIEKVNKLYIYKDYVNLQVTNWKEIYKTQWMNNLLL